MKNYLEFESELLHKTEGNYIYNYSGVHQASTKLRFRGTNNILVVAEGVEIKNTVIDFRASNSILYVGTSFLRAHIILGHDVSIYIGSGTTFTNTCNITAAEGYDILMGENCMVAEDVYITNTDGHPIFDEAGQRVNPGKDISIGDHVWIGRGAEILKGVKLHSGSIVGAKSVVTKDIAANCVSVGNPNRIVREDVSFGRYTTLNLPEERYQKIETPDMFEAACLGDVNRLKKIKSLQELILNFNVIG